MSWVRPIVACAALALSTSASAAIVVASSGPSAGQYPPGKKLDDAGRITLQQGDSVTVLDARGTKILKGPGRLSVSQPGRALPNPAYAVLTRRNAASRARTGAVRDPTVASVNPNLWYVDLTRPGTQCLTAPGTVTLWRPETKKAARYKIGGTPVSFPVQASTADWAGPISDGMSLTVSSESGAAVASYKFAVIASPPADAEGLALVLIEKGCTAQLDLLSRTLSMSKF